jgi:hypothetical protein
MNPTNEVQTPTEMQPTVVLTPEQIQFFHDNGYLSIPQITTPKKWR